MFNPYATDPRAMGAAPQYPPPYMMDPRLAQGMTMMMMPPMPPQQQQQQQQQQQHQMMMMQGPPPDMRTISQAIARLTLPVQTVQLDPLVVQCQALVVMTPNGLADCVAALEGLLLREKSKLPIVYFIDALLRSQTSPATARLREALTRNLENVFSAAFDDADAYAQEKMLSIVNIWEGNQARPRTFPSEVLMRIRARIDPRYQGPPLSSLPLPAPFPVRTSIAMPMPAPQYQNPPSYMPAYAGPQAAAPPPLPVNYMGPPASAYGPHTVAPGYVPVVASQPYPPPAPPVAVSETALRRASELLSSFVAQATPPGQMLTLAQLQVEDRGLYDRLIGQAQLEVSALTAATASSQQAWRPPGVVDDPNTLAQSLIMTDESVYRSVHLARVASKLDKSTARVRCWYAPMSEWVKGGEMRRPYQVVSLFADKAPATEVAIDPRKFAVPKDDSQPNCALSGEPFETFWSDETQQWMFSNAIRPDPNGPIYNILAWNQQLAANNNISVGNAAKRARVEDA